MSLETDFQDLADAAAALLAEARGEELQATLANIKKICDSAKRAWSGSNLGYHASVYYQEVTPCPGNVQFSPEWGLMDVWPTHQPHEGWQMMEHQDVIDMLLKRAGVADAKTVASALASVRGRFSSLKEQAISVLLAANPEKRDSYLTRKMQDVEKLIFASPEHIASTLVKEVWSRDSTAASQGLRVAPHQELTAICLAATVVENGLEALEKALRESALHLRRLAKATETKPDGEEPSSLDPWPVIRGFLLNLSSDDVPAIIDRAGLAVDWQVSKADNFSHKTRLRAYRTRIDAAYRMLSKSSDRLRVAFVVAREVATRGLSEDQEEALREIGWKLEGGQLRPSAAPVRELFLPEQSQHDAYVEIRGILKRAKSSIAIIDPYIDQSILSLLSGSIPPKTAIRILTSKYPPDLPLEAKKWLSQNSGSTLEIRVGKEFHDRFIVLDDSTCWHVGALTCSPVCPRL